MPGDRRSPRRPFQEFFQTESAGGVVLLVCACAAIAIANSPWSDRYEQVWTTRLDLVVMDREVALNLRNLINDGLMSIFFLLVGLEIKRELVAGELASPRQAALPIAGAIGGMIVPALLYLMANPAGPAGRGWAIPMATDIAFALGSLSLIVPNTATGMRVFLAALAIVDDMGAVVVIALFYTRGLAVSSFAIAAMIFVALLLLNARGVRRLAPYLVLGAGLWFFVHESGVHATIAAALLAFTIPALAAPVLERSLHGFSAFAIMPLFALANAGVRLEAGAGGSIAIGVAAGLAIGKPVGITAAAFAAVRSGLAALPTGVTWRQLHGCAWLGGIGFTMSLFIATLAFDGTALLASAKLGIIAGSVTAGLVAAVLFRISKART